MDDTLTVRRAGAEDVPAIRSIAEAAWHAAYSDFLEADAIRRALAEWYAPERIEAGIERPATTYLVADVDEVRGYCSIELDGDVASLSSIYVDPAHWGEGYGSALLERALALAREAGAARIEVLVAPENRIGRSFYEAKGFAVAGEEWVESFDGDERVVRYARAI
ncbi:GNAT family N-acetyltransferase [Natronobiforma cellulositropha]|uniref:GNAT family N-acetyltransferase n=1 Tax=Natronobiforma cellulositropha TaxID=1679076 RepID=UPI0021D5DED4|nr:GNAT family N-acetyltransferase [Natronobiforma cellulositropha]